MDSLVSRAILAVAQHDGTRLVVGGGVAANKRLRQELERRTAAAGVELFLPSLKLCTDNAAMVAARGFQLLAAGEVLDMRADVFARG